MELFSTVWETPDGGRFITLDYGGKVRKHMYDLDNDGVIERESWSTGPSSEFTATRRTALPIPSFLLPETASGGYDMARLDSLPPDSAARLDPFRRAMEGPGALPGGPMGPGADTLRRARAEAVVRGPAADTTSPEPGPARAAPRPAGPLGQPVQLDSVRRNLRDR